MECLAYLYSHTEEGQARVEPVQHVVQRVQMTLVNTQRLCVVPSGKHIALHNKLHYDSKHAQAHLVLAQ